MNTRSSRWWFGVCGVVFAGTCARTGPSADRAAGQAAQRGASDCKRHRGGAVRLLRLVLGSHPRRRAVHGGARTAQKGFESAFGPRRGLAQAGQMQVRSGAFSVTPHYGREGKDHRLAGQRRAGFRRQRLCLRIGQVSGAA